MRIKALFILITFFSSLVSAAVINFEAFGISKSKVYNLSENRMYIGYSNEGIFTTDMGVRGEGECQGIVEISGKKTVSNVMCKYKDQDGDIFFGHFKAISESDINTQGTQSFSIEEGTGKWKELVGEKCIGATSSISTKDLGEGNFKGKIMWAGKCNISDVTLERVKNYKKAQ